MGSSGTSEAVCRSTVDAAGQTKAPQAAQAGAREEVFCLVLLFLFSVAVRVLWSLHNASNPMWDFAGYYGSAKASVESGHLHQYAVFKGPGTVVILALWMATFGKSLASLFVLNALAGGVGVVSTYLLAQSLTGRRGVRWLSAGLVAVYPELLNMSALIAAENFALPGLLLSALVITRLFRWRSAWKIAAGGAVLGLTSLIRPLLILGLPFLALGFLIDSSNRRLAIHRSRAARSLLFTLGICVSVLPWSAYATARSDGHPVIISSYAPLVFYCAHNPVATSGWGPSIGARGSVIPSFRERTDTFAQEGQYALRYCLRHPAHLLANFPCQWRLLFGEPEANARSIAYQRASMYESAEGHRHLRPPDLRSSYRLSVLSLAIFYAGYLGGMLEALVLALKRPWDSRRWLLFFVANLIVLHCVVLFGEPRFLVPWFPILILLASMLIVDVFSLGGRARLWDRAPRFRSAIAAGAGVLALAGLVGALLPRDALLFFPDRMFAERYQVGGGNVVSEHGVVFDWAKYGRPRPVMTTPVKQDRYSITFRIRVEHAGAYDVYSKYSSVTSRPVELTANNGPAIMICEERLTSSWKNKDSILVKESESLHLDEGANSVTIASGSVFPHIEAIYLLATNAP
jgi:4-amino-4-deoxy-L-arabinose transferase-like glycosyltransferase